MSQHWIYYNRNVQIQSPLGKVVNIKDKFGHHVSQLSGTVIGGELKVKFSLFAFFLNIFCYTKEFLAYLISSYIITFQTTRLWWLAALPSAWNSWEQSVGTHQSGMAAEPCVLI
jgi:hypothetical protein